MKTIGVICTAVVAVMLANALVAQTNDVTTVRITAYDYQCQDDKKARISNHTRFDTALHACLKNPRGKYLQGGVYEIRRSAVTPPPTCPVAPSSQTREQTCPTGTTGTFTQSSTSIVGPAPACTVTTTWAPTTPPAGSCPVTAPEPPVIPPPPVNEVPGQATIVWTHDGVGVTKYRIHYGTGPGAWSVVDVSDPKLRTFVVKPLAPGVWMFHVSAFYNTVETEKSNRASLTVTAP